MPASKALVQAIAVTAELTGTQLSAPAAKVMAEDLARYPEYQVLGALVRCRKELKSRLTIADVVTRLDDGRPGPEEAWALLPKGEAESCFWTDEMCEAGAVAAALMTEGEMVQARMAFTEKYRTLVQQARDGGKAVRWMFSPGTSKSGRELAILDAVEKGRINADRARDLLPYHRLDEGLNARLLAITAGALRSLESQEG